MEIVAVPERTMNVLAGAVAACGHAGSSMVPKHFVFVCLFVLWGVLSLQGVPRVLSLRPLLSQSADWEEAPGSCLWLQRKAGAM